MDEIGRLAPSAGKDGERGCEKLHFPRLRKNDVNRVLKHVTATAGEHSPSLQDVRKATAEGLGIDRTQKTRETKKKWKRRKYVDFPQHLCEDIFNLTNSRKSVSAMLFS